MRDGPFHPERPDSEPGFTLIELLVVMVILGILAAVAIPVFLGQRQKAADATIRSDLKSAAVTAESFFADTAKYSTLAAGNFSRGSAGNVLTFNAVTDESGFCLKGTNPRASTGGIPATFFWYDSKAGGLRSGVPVAAAPAGGACAGTLGPAVVIP